MNTSSLNEMSNDTYMKRKHHMGMKAKGRISNTII